MTTPLPPVDKPLPINGSPADNPEQPPVRRELRDMKRNHAKEWALFLLGLDRFKNTDESHPLSWFQIAGIHGRPFTTWPNEPWNKGKIKQADPTMRETFQWQGFCTHSSILFLPWHRPYLALFETELRRHVQAVAEEFTVEEGRDDYLQAAKDFRLPYWDWALPADKDNGVFPVEALANTKHDIVFPKSRTVKQFSTNPLAAYKFGSIGSRDNRINTFRRVNATIRWPLRDGATSDEANMREALVSLLQTPELPSSVPNNDPIFKKGKNLTERVLYLLQSYDSFGPISSNYFFDEQKFANWGSLEDIHNAVHSYVGNGGHMSDPGVAAFDPIFWLHHANLDRLYAIWQALWDKGGDDQYVTPKRAQVDGRRAGGTFSNPWRGDDTIDTELTPFTKSEEGTMWTSRGVRGTTSFGYVYPETQSWLYPTKDKILEQLYKLYPNASLANNLKAASTDLRTASVELQARANTLLALEAAPLKTSELVQIASTPATDVQEKLAVASQKVAPPAERKMTDLVHDSKYLEWLVDLRAEKHALGGNFVVHVFLGDPDDENPFLYIADPNHVAVFSTFGTDDSTGCENCKRGQEAQLKVTGQIPLTVALVERYLAGKLDSLKPDDVVPYLQQNLHWRVTDQSGVRGSRAAVDGLLVSVVSNEVTLPEDPSVPAQYARTVTPWPAATTRVNGEGRGRGTGYTGS